MMGMDGGRRLFDQETTKPKNLSETLGNFAQYFRKYWYTLLLVLALISVSTWAQVTAPKLVGQAIDCYLFNTSAFAGVAGAIDTGIVTDSCWWTDDDSATIVATVNADESIAAADKQDVINSQRNVGLGLLVLSLLGIYLMASIMQGFAFFTMAWTGQNVLRQIRKDLFKQMTRLSLNYYTKNEAGDVMSRITNDTDTLQQIFGFALLSVVSGFMLIIWIMYEMLAANVVYALVVLTVVPVMLIMTIYISQQARKAFRITRQEIGSINADLQESIAGAREVQAFTREEENIEQFAVRNAANRDANIRAAAFTSALNPVLEALGYIALALVVIAGGYSLLTAQPLLGIGSVVTLGLAITFLQYTQRFSQPIQQIATLWTNIQSAIAGGERIFGLLEIPIDIPEKENAIALSSVAGNVRFDDVWAEYEEGKPVLKGVSFEAQSGQMVAIVGPTGAGKTTIINLLSRFYDVTQGSIKVDGHDVRDVTLDSLRSQIGLVLQDSFLFSDTVMNNIRYGKLDATDEEIMEAAKMVAAHEFIERLPEGYNTVLGERGSGLSQGQRQLIAIARAALLDPRMLILDEATSSVDTRTERIIQSAFERLMGGRTSFVIAHRLSTIRNADLLLVVNNGQIVERGTHTSLLEAEGEYYDLYMSQFRYEETDETPSNEPVAGD